MSIEKIPLGVTVRQIEYVDDPTVSTAAHPVYALLISREVDVDQSHLIDDGLTAEQRKEIKDEKDNKRMAKQVEADLGGFDVDQEWVEEIEREECFEIEKRYGGAPPIPQSKYEVWVSVLVPIAHSLLDITSNQNSCNSKMMDASNWQILDTYQLDEYEHGMSMKVMTLSDVSLYSWT
jgi:cleavage and polyadenylation specificity factor subunit 1